MKISERQLRRIIKEELELVLEPIVGVDAGVKEKPGEGKMARGQLGRIAEVAPMIQAMIHEDTDLDEWVEAKITKAHDYLTTILDYMKGKKNS
jgi:hypothetical protein